MAETRVHEMLASKKDPDLDGAIQLPLADEKALREILEGKSWNLSSGNWKAAAQRRGRQPGRSSASTAGEATEIACHSERCPSF
jgi:hypothetical protein